MDLKCDYAKGWVIIDTPEYVILVLAKINHPDPVKPQHASHPCATSVYGSWQQQTPKDTSKAPLLDKDGTQRVHSINGTFLHYGRAINLCILPALNKISSKQTKPTTNTSIKCDMSMYYNHTNLKAVIWYNSIEMILKIVSDTAFLVLFKQKFKQPPSIN